MKKMILAALLALTATVAVAKDATKTKEDAAAGFYGNTMRLVDAKTGKFVGTIWYNKDGTYQNTRDGKPGSGTWVINNGQDSKTMCMSHHDPDGIHTFCHPFDAYKKVGDTWMRQENAGLMQVTLLPGHV